MFNEAKSPNCKAPVDIHHAGAGVSKQRSGGAFHQEGRITTMHAGNGQEVDAGRVGLLLKPGYRAKSHLIGLLIVLVEAGHHIGIATCAALDFKCKTHLFVQ
jgi:hypothetical protein